VDISQFTTWRFTNFVLYCIVHGHTDATAVVTLSAKRSASVPFRSSEGRCENDLAQIAGYDICLQCFDAVRWAARRASGL